MRFFIVPKLVRQTLFNYLLPRSLTLFLIPTTCILIELLEFADQKPLPKCMCLISSVNNIMSSALQVAVLTRCMAIFWQVSWEWFHGPLGLSGLIQYLYSVTCNIHFPVQENVWWFQILGFLRLIDVCFLIISWSVCMHLLPRMGLPILDKINAQLKLQLNAIHAIHL